MEVFGCNMGGGEVRDFVFISVTYNTSLAGLSNVMLKTTVSLSVGGENQTFFFFFFYLILTLLRNSVMNVH